MVNILDFDKIGKERKAKDYQEQCDEIEKVIFEKSIEFGWTIKQLEHFAGRIMPEIVSVKVNNYLLDKKVNEIKDVEN